MSFNTPDFQRRSYDSTLEQSPPRLVNDDREVVEWHRKVYLGDRKPQEDLVIHPLSITIPVKVPEYRETELPTPKPVFKMRKYVKYVNKPEVQMIPITKTIIKPVGVTSDQIITDTGYGPSSRGQQSSVDRQLPISL